MPELSHPSKYNNRWVTRATALKYTCPECNSAPGQACEKDPLTIPSHMARHEAAIAAGEQVTKVQAKTKKQRQDDEDRAQRYPQQ